MLQLFGIASAIVVVMSIVPYVKDILGHKTKPERASWFIWTVLGGIAFFSQMAKGATDSLWLTAAGTVGVLLVFLLSLRFGTGGLAKRDIISLCIAGIGLVLWYFTSEATIALFMVIAIDALGTYLTVLKSYEHPGSETLISWIFFSLSGVFGMLAVGKLDLILLSYPGYICVANLFVIGAIYLGRRKQ